MQLFIQKRLSSGIQNNVHKTQGFNLENGMKMGLNEDGFKTLRHN